ncbi:MAG: universal stress protein [Hyphomicrobiaceae bacterium]|nr:universal stress protein [Hyphomicrobiaceae bacterium]MCC0011022.1 universal stress protein [Hyphomicrobiaceae bacterium]
MTDKAQNDYDQASASDETTAERFSILVCTDGSDESFAALKYAVRIGSGTDADLTLLYIRPMDQGLRMAGLQASLARENMLNWGLELPGTKALRRARDRLVELEWLSVDWEQTITHKSVAGDPLGDNVTTYTSKEGRSIALKLHVATTIAEGILDECERGNYDLTIIAKSEDDDAAGPGHIHPETADRVALEHSGTVLVTRALEESHGHLVCVTDEESSIRAARRDAVIAARCMCPVYLLSVASEEEGRETAARAIAAAKSEIEAAGIRPSGEIIVIGDPITEIVEEGKKYSVIVLSPDASRSRWRRFFSKTTTIEVLKRAHNSVMVVR